MANTLTAYPGGLTFDEVGALVQDYYMPPIRDQYFLGNVLYWELRRRGRVKKYAGGRAIVQPLSFSPEGKGGQWWSGVDKLNTQVVSPITSAVYFRKNFSLPVVLTRDEEDSVNGPTALTSLLSAKMEIARPSAVEAVQKSLYSDGTDPKMLTGLEYALKSGSSGTQTAPSMTYGGISASTSNNTWWNAQYDNAANGTYATGSGGTFASDGPGFGPIGKMYSRIARLSGKRPNLLLSNWGLYSDYEFALNNQVRYTQPQQRNDLAEAGFLNLMYKKAAWVVDEMAPHDSSNKEILYYLFTDAMWLVIHQDRDMSWDNWREPTDQKVRVGYIDWSGELVITERRAFGKISNVDATLTT